MRAVKVTKAVAGDGEAGVASAAFYGAGSDTFYRAEPEWLEFQPGGEQDATKGFVVPGLPQFSAAAKPCSHLIAHGEEDRREEHHAPRG